MITTKELFKFKNIQLFNPYDGVEFIYSILQGLGYCNNNFKSKKGRKEGLEVIEKLFELELIEIFSWGKYVDKLKSKELSNSEKMKFIEELWFIEADYPDFLNMPMFKFKKWYIKNLEKHGFNHFTNWEWFVKNKIGDLEKFIENNRPID
jgi:hypothetical protein